MFGRQWGKAVCYGLPGFVLGLGLAVGLEGRVQGVAAQTAAQGTQGASQPRAHAGEPARTQARRPGPGLGGGETPTTLSFVTAGTGNGQLLYIVDSRRQAFAIYRVDPTNPNGTVKLEASRQYKWDLELEHYNNQAPEPAAIEATVKTLAGQAR